jgi:transmembrane sensor
LASIQAAPCDLTAASADHAGAACERAWMDANQITPIETEPMDPAAWVDGVISVRDQSLGEVIEALRPYQTGIIRISPQAARVRIFGVFSLAQPQQMLQDLVNTHPIQIRQWGSWLTVIEMSESGT